MSKEAFAALYGIARVEQELKLKNRLSVFMRGLERLGKAPFSSTGDVAEAVVVYRQPQMVQLKCSTQAHGKWVSPGEVSTASVSLTVLRLWSIALRSLLCRDILWVR
jgi:hypothetical protein